MTFVLPHTALFGGTFDPPHYGHLYIAQKVWEQGFVDKILWLPNGQPPHKSKTHCQDQDRIEMLQLFLEDQPHFSIERMEIDSQEISYTINTLQKFPPQQPVSLISGTDSVIHYRWKSQDEILKRLTYWFILTREGFSASKLSDWVRSHPPQERKKIRIITCEPPDLSSTEIRHLASKGKNLEGLTSSSVVNYIHKNKLYRENTLESKELALKAASTLDDNKATDVLALDVTNFTIVSEYFVIASASTRIQTRDLCEKVEHKLEEENNLRPSRIQGRDEGSWIVLDYGFLMVHIFLQQERDFYGLENRWSKAENIFESPHPS